MCWFWQADPSIWSQADLSFETLPKEYQMLVLVCVRYLGYLKRDIWRKVFDFIWHLSTYFLRMVCQAGIKVSNNLYDNGHIHGTTETNPNSVSCRETLVIKQLLVLTFSSKHFSCSNLKEMYHFQNQIWYHWYNQIKIICFLSKDIGGHSETQYYKSFLDWAATNGEPQAAQNKRQL